MLKPLPVALASTFFLLLAAAFAFSFSNATATVQTVSLQGLEVTLYKTPTCGCCSGHAATLEAAGMRVYKIEVELPELMAKRAEYGVPISSLSCHTAIIEGYAVEGHVPLEAIQKLLTEKPTVDGIALPGMPQGSLGMSGIKTAPFEVESFKDSVPQPFLSL